MRPPKAFWTLILVIFIIIFAYSVFMFFGRGFFCAWMSWQDTKVTITTYDDYLNRVLIYRKICGEGLGFLPIIISSVGMYYGFKGWVLSSVRIKE